MQTTPTLALIGAGHWGKNLARNFYTLEALHTICDAHLPLLDTYRELYTGVHLTANFQAVLDNPAILQVAIATPAVTHYHLAKQALLANKDVYVEKPLCLDVEEANELVLLANQRQKILMVGHLLQYHPAVCALQRMNQAGKFGKVHYISSHRLSFGQIRTAENNLWSFAPHDISVILSLLCNQLPTTVSCTGQSFLTKGLADLTLTSLHFGEEVKAHIYTSWINPVKEQKLTVIGTQGMAVFDDMQSPEQKLAFYPHTIEWLNGVQPKAKPAAVEYIALPLQEPLREECLHFLKCCQERISPKTDAEEGLRVLQVLQAAENSLQNEGQLFNPSKRVKPYFLHATAIVDDGAQIGEKTKIWHFSHIMSGAIVGKECNIGQNVVISPEVRLGNRVKIQNNVSIYTGVTCEDDVFLGPSMVFTNVINPRSAVVRRDAFRQTIVRQGATIGANATIVCGTILGAYCFIGAGAVVTKEVKPFALMVGNPAKQRGWMSKHGERLELPLTSVEPIHANCPATQETYTLCGDELTFKALQSISPTALS